MNKSALQNYCLEKMGIPQFVQIRIHYLMGIPIQTIEANTFSEEKQQLLEKMREAMGWEKDVTKTILLPPNAFEILKQKIASYQPKKILLFDDKSPEENPFKLRDGENTIWVAHLPSLDTLLTTPVAKREAWHIMQSLRNKSIPSLKKDILLNGLK